MCCLSTVTDGIPERRPRPRAAVRPRHGRSRSPLLLVATVRCLRSRPLRQIERVLQHPVRAEAPNRPTSWIHDLAVGARVHDAAECWVLALGVLANRSAVVDLAGLAVWSAGRARLRTGALGAGLMYWSNSPRQETSA